MNFLAHYHFDRTDSPTYNLGLILPDLYRNFNRGLRITKAQLNDLQHPSHLLAGSRRHFVSDDRFHSSEVFKSGESMLLNQLRAEDAPVFDRDYFIAHIYYELLLDHVLLNRYCTLAEELYSDFRSVSKDELKGYLHMFNKNAVERFLQGFDHFNEAAYLQSYHEPDSVVFALGKICNKMNIAPFNEDQKIHLLKIMHQLKPIIAKDLTQLRVWLKD
jgi:acyl carrier protein phosphodiesterase